MMNKSGLAVFQKGGAYAFIQKENRRSGRTGGGIN